MTEYPRDLVDDGAAHILLADEYGHLGPYTDEQIAWARKVLGISEDLEHCGDCTNAPATCQLCAREEYQRKMRAALAAIDASGTHAVVPRCQTEAMLDAAADAVPQVQPDIQASSIDWIKAEWHAQIDACLAERRGEGR